MSREVQVRFCESRGVRFPPATHLVVLVHGTQADAETLREEIADVLTPLGLRLSPAKTRIVHLSEGFDFLGVRHEAPSIRVEVKDRHRCAVAAA